MMRKNRRVVSAVLWVGAFGMVGAAVVGCGANQGPSATGTKDVGAGPSASAMSTASTAGGANGAVGTLPPGGVPAPAHVVVVVMENHGLRSVMGSAKAPWVNSLQGALFTNWHGTSRPSQPNYLAMFSGSDKGVADDHCPLNFTGDNLAAQLLAGGRTFVGYSEGLPAAGSTECIAYPYARKHNPWVDFSALPTTINQPFTAFPTDYETLPTVSFVVPGLCHDTHDCSVAQGDAWLQAQLGGYATWAQTHNSLLIITYDEDEDTAANLIPTLFVGPMVTSGNYDTRYDHYSLLSTLETMYGLPRINQAATAPPVTGVWK